eukprot:12807257-Alexandrium_andersonii.AAC.1
MAPDAGRALLANARPVVPAAAGLRVRLAPRGWRRLRRARLAGPGSRRLWASHRRLRSARRSWLSRKMLLGTQLRRLEQASTPLGAAP